MKRPRRLALAAALAVLACGCDQLTKFHAEEALSVEVQREGESIRVATQPVDVVPGYWEFQYRENEGAAFSFLEDLDASVRIPIFILVTLFALAFLAVTVWRHPNKWQTFGAALVAGGAVGNLIDRVRIGHVVDFIHWHVQDRFDYPTFNVADAWILIGVLLLLFASFRMRRTSPQPRTD